MEDRTNHDPLAQPSESADSAQPGDQFKLQFASNNLTRKNPLA
jgi:hypothetical protein